ncbi:MAG: hypothetical protein ACXU8U_03960 [Asticcacaulis sp.]
MHHIKIGSKWLIFALAALLTIFFILCIALVLALPKECLQFKSANCDAAQRLNLETIFGIFVSGIGTIALLATVYYSHKATAAATEAITHARTSTAREFRPYVTPLSVCVRKYNVEGKTYGFEFNTQLSNVGKTPAVKCTTIMKFHWQSEALQEDYEFSDSDGDKLYVGTIMSGDYRTLMSPTFSLDFLHGIFTGEIILIQHGWIEYSDSSSGERFRTEFAANIMANIDPLLGLETTFNFSPIEKFCGMDDDCLRRPQAYEPIWKNIAPIKLEMKSDLPTIQ